MVVVCGLEVVALALLEALLFDLPVFCFWATKVFVFVDAERFFLAVRILCAFTPALVASMGDANMLTIEATSMAQKMESREGLYPRSRGMLMEVR